MMLFIGNFTLSKFKHPVENYFTLTTPSLQGKLANMALESGTIKLIVSISSKFVHANAYSTTIFLTTIALEFIKTLTMNHYSKVI